MTDGHRGPAAEGMRAQGPAVIPHRKNAAEWVMWAVLWPVAWVVRRFSREERGR